MPLFYVLLHLFTIILLSRVLKYYLCHYFMSFHNQKGSFLLAKYFCRDIVLSLYRSSTERFRDMQLMSLNRLCRDIVRLPPSHGTRKILFKTQKTMIIMYNNLLKRILFSPFLPIPKSKFRCVLGKNGVGPPPP